MSTARHRTRAVILGGLLGLALAACASAPRNQPPPPPPAAPPPPPLEASYDWHGLLLVPFGSLLKEIPFTLHEVLLFRDATHPAQADDAECYAMEQTAPRFVARTPSEYMLCFRHDRLARVQTTVALPRGEAAQILSDACGLWQRNAAAGVPAAGVPAADQPAADPPGADQRGACVGRDGAIGYAGRLDQEETQGDAPLTVTLEVAAEP